MSIVIRGMEMPKNCDECYFVGYGYPDWCGLPQIPNGKDEIVDINTRPDWCPLIELPEKHGRLIDEAVLKKNVLKWMPNDPCGREEKEFPFETDICVSMMMEIEEQPTVLEAEGEQEC